MKKPRIDIGKDSTIELERDYFQIVGERLALALMENIVSDDGDECEALYLPAKREIQLLRAYATLDSFGTGAWEEIVHGICDHAEINLPHEQQVILAHSIWLAQATFNDLSWWR